MKPGYRPSQIALRHVLYHTALAGAAAAAMVAPANAQRAVALSYQEKPGYARIVAKWADGDEAAPKVTARVDSQVLVFRFDQKVAIDLDALKSGLPSWASVARMDADGMGARIALSRDAKMHLSTSADLVAVDISPAETPQFPSDIVSPLVAKKAKAAEAARIAALPPAPPIEELEVRGSQTGGSSRIGFYWPSAVTYKIVEQKPGMAKILFSRRGKADLAYMHVDPPANVADFKAENTDKGYLATITSKNELPIRVYLDGSVVTVDISKDDPDKAKAAQEIVDAAKPQPKPAPVAKPLQPKGGEIVSKPAPPPAVLTNSAPPPRPADSRPILLTPPKVDIQIPVAIAPPTATLIGGADHQTALNAAWHDPAPRSGVIEVKVLPLQTGLELQVPFAAPAPAAVFTRGNATWAVFAANADLRIDPTALPAGYRVRALRAKNATMFRLEAPKGLTVSAEASEGVWTVRIAPTALPPKRFLRPTRRAGDDGRMRMETMLTGAAGIVWIDDPVIGDRIAAAVAYGPSSASQTPRDSFEALLMASAHGLGVAPKSDNVMVTLEGELVAVSFADNGQTTPDAVAAESKAAGAAAPAFVDFARWGGKTGADWFKARDALDLRASRVDPATPEGTAALLDLARFYLGHEMAHEALGVLKAASHAHRDVEQDPNFLGMRGAANVMVHRMKAADEDLAKGHLRNDPSAALWRGMVAVDQEDWERANDFFRQSGEQIFAYTPKWAATFAAASAEAALHVNDYDLARRRAEQATQQGGKGEAAERGKMVLANLSAIVEGPAAAYDKFVGLAKEASEPVAVKAELRRLELGVLAGKMTANDAAVQLESLRFRWRGDDVEMQTVGILADQYMRVGRFREALLLAKSTALRDASAPGARELRIKLTDYFRKLYLDGQADRLDPIQALALFYEFKDLTPIGADGDQMIRKLAQRLVAFDLVEPAAELLQYQIDNRVRGVAKAAIAVDLATIYLRDRRPDRALQAIASSREPQLPKDLVLQRRLIEAAAYRDLGRFDHTVELVEALDGVEAKSLLADAYWRDRKWAEAAKVYAAMMQATDEKTPRRNDLALKAAIAARMAPDPLLLLDLRRKWLTLFQNDPNKASFDLITAPTDASGAAVSEAARRLADAPRVDAFEAAMKKRFEGIAAPPPSGAATSGKSK